MRAARGSCINEGRGTLKITVELKTAARGLNAAALDKRQFCALQSVLRRDASGEDVAVLEAVIAAHTADVTPDPDPVDEAIETDGGDRDLVATVGRTVDFKKLSADETRIYFAAKETVRSGNGLALDLADRAALIKMIPESV